MKSRRRVVAALAIFAILGATAVILLAAGRVPICTCGTVKLWHGAVQSAENSQHLLDWYSLSHVVHGFLFYLGGWLLLRRRPVSVRIVLATLLEAAWEIAENAPRMIERYRTATIAIGYTGDSVINSLADIGCMLAGFAVARRVPVRTTIAITIGFELFTLWAIRDNLTLNVWMLIAPNDAIRSWQAG